MVGVPEDPSTPKLATDRVAARVFLLDADGCVLLLNGCDSARPDAGNWWFTPGGGIDPGETAEDAARREVREETGLVVDVLGDVVFRRVAHFDFEGVHYRQTEAFFCVRCDRFVIDDAGWSEVERRTVLGHRWWSPAELASTNETIFPDEIAGIVADLS
jgi:8-oxo-dGTP pyrophosphatase MutT (NUDIX family)